MDLVQRLARYVAGVELWGVGLAVLLSMVAAQFLPWLVVLIVVFWGIRWLAWGKLSVPTRLDVPLAILVLIIPLNYWITPIPEKSLPQLLRLLVGTGFFYAIVNWMAFDLSANNFMTRKRFTRMLWIVLIGAVGLAVYSLFSVEWITYKLPFISERIYSYASILVGDTVHPNVMAGTLVIILPILLGVILFAGGDISKWQRLIFVFSILSVFLVLILTQSLGALLSFGAALLSLILLRWRWWGWMVVAVGMIIGSWMIWQTGFEKVLDAVLVSATLSGVNGREQIWQRALYMIQDFPFTGVGMGLFGDVADTLYPFAGIEPGRIPHAHQLFLQVAVDLGLPGFAAWLTILGMVILSAWQVYSFAKAKNDGWMAGLGAGLFGSQVALCVHGLLDAVTWGMVRPAPLVWGVWGFTVAAWMLKERM